MKEEKSTTIAEEKPENEETGEDNEELPDDPLARIDALLRQLQKAARGSDCDQEDKEKVA